MRRLPAARGAKPWRNYAARPRFTGYSNAGQGRLANNRFTGNVTYTDVTGAADGPTLPDGSKLARYARLAVTTSRTRLGFHVADVIENASPTPAAQITVVPGEQVRVAVLLRASAAASVTTYARAATAAGAWVEGAPLALAATSLAAGEWAWVAGVYTVPAGAKTVSLAVWSPAALANGVTLDAAALVIHKGAVPRTYTDPLMSPDFAWTGTASDSESTGHPYLPTDVVPSPWTVGAATKLSWEPPFDPASPPAGTKVVAIDDTSARRHINGGGGRVLLQWPATPVTDVESVGTYEALVTVENFTDLVSIGGRVHIVRIDPTTLTAAVAENDTTITVASTAGFPAAGMLRVDGESMRYTAKTATTFTGITRRSGFFNSSPVSSSTTHAVGAKVYISERHRTPIGVSGFTGVAHIEGLHLTGFTVDGPRVSGGTGTLRVQRTRVEGVTCYDTVYQTDAHPDGMQAYGGGCAEIDADQVSVVLGPNGNGFLNRGTDSAPSTPVGQWRLRNFEVLSPTGNARSMFANSDGASTAFEVVNGWLRYDAAQAVIGSSGTGIRPMFSEQLYRPGQVDIVPASRCGIGYTTPGYL